MIIQRAFESASFTTIAFCSHNILIFLFRCLGVKFSSDSLIKSLNDVDLSCPFKTMVTFSLSNYLGTANEENYKINLDLIQITDSIEF